MALEGEITGGHSTTTCECGKLLPLMVCHSAAGYYIGYFCPYCGPYGRESSYFRSEPLAKAYLYDLLENNNTLFLRNTDYTGK
jgi:hypothetical protein